MKNAAARGLVRRLTARAAAYPHVWRYALAITGPIGVAGSQFLVSLSMIHLLSAGAFGSFSFLMVANVLSWGICSALFCAPMPIMLYQSKDSAERDRGEAMLVAASALFAIGSALLLGLLAAWLGLDRADVALFALYAWASISRYFARSHALARHDQLKATASDILFFMVVCAGLVLALLAGRSNGGTLIYAALAVGALAGLVPFGTRYIWRDLVVMRWRRTAGYAHVWRRMSAWSVLGVVTTEATNNAHAYLVTWALGPAAFAPLAASALVTRPVSVISTALSDFERPRLARHIGEGTFTQMRQSLRHFRWAIAAAWAITALAVAALFLIAPRLIFPPSYPLGYMATGAILWMLVAGARLAAIPPSCVLIANGSFRVLAMSSLWSGLLAVAAVGALMFAADTIWSITGILLGQLVYALVIQKMAARWLDGQTDRTQDAPA